MSMNRKISYTLNKIERMREHFRGTDFEEKANELADAWEKTVTNPHGVYAEVLHHINDGISSLGVR